MSRAQAGPLMKSESPVITSVGALDPRELGAHVPVLDAFVEELQRVGIRTFGRDAALEYSRARSSKCAK